MKIQTLTYLSFLYFLLLLQSCSKSKIDDSNSENAVPDQTGTSAAINTSTGLDIHQLNATGVFHIISNNSQYLDLTTHSGAQDNNPKLTTLADVAYQKWDIKNLGNGYFTIANYGSKKILESSDNQVKQNDFNNHDKQLWQLIVIKDKYYKIINKANGLALTDSEDGKIKLTSFSSSKFQYWGFNKLVNQVKLSITNLIQSNMVIQSGKPFKILGKADVDATVNVKASWNSELFTTQADASGNWVITLPPAQVTNIPQTLTCSIPEGKTIEFDNLLIGEVWLCAGQSNMAMPMTKISDAFGGFHGVYNYQSEIASANYPNIRMLTIPNTTSSTPKDSLKSAGSWVVCNPTHANSTNFSAVAYYFARKLHQTLPSNVPVGVIVAAVPATAIEQWSSAETIAENPITQNYYTASYNSNLYNGMIHPLKNVAIKGILWYQGESNLTNEPVSNYTVLHRNMIKGWRSLFNQGTLPFYFVQLPAIGTLFADISLYKNALFREAQSQVRNIENTGMACVMDTNEPYNIHNIFKQPVGERLALLALDNDYQLPVKSVGPQFVSYTQNGNTISINFRNAEGLTAHGKTSPQHFFVASASDKKFVAATNFTVTGNSIQLAVPNGMSVDAIRYAFTDISVTYITNDAGLPMEPFRTDNW